MTIMRIMSIMSLKRRISKNNINYMEVEVNGWNSNNLLIAQIKFYLRESLPYFLGGFKKRLILKFKKFR